MCNLPPCRREKILPMHIRKSHNFTISIVILFAFNYLRNLAVSPRESFPICQKNGLKLYPIRCTIFPIGDSLGSKTKVREYRVTIRNVIF